MSVRILKKIAKTLIIDAGSSARQNISDTLKAIGFQDIQGVASVKDALGVLEVEHVDWIITPLLSDQPVTALHVLKICTEHYDLRDVRVTLLLDETEFECLPFAFELGLLSWSTRPCTKESLQGHVADLLGRLEASEANSCLVAADYLRICLVQAKRHVPLLSLEESLLQIFPGSTRLLTKLAEAQHAAGKQDKARVTLSQARLLDDSCRDEVDTLAKKFFGDQGLNLNGGNNVAGSSGINALGLGTCVVVDADETILRSIQGILAEVGVGKVEAFSDGDAAWTWFKANPEPSLIVQEWRIPKVPGPVLLQRIRQQGYVNVPVVILSSLIKQEDTPLVREMGAADVITKPFDKAQFLKAIVWTIQQDRMPTEQATLERKMRALLAAGKRSEAEGLRGTYVGDPKITAGRKCQIEAEFAYFDGNFVGARDQAVEALKQLGNSILNLNLLAKCLMRLRDFGSAVKFFEKAQSMSPLNIERLCALAEAHTELGNTEKASTSLAEASTLDPDSQMVKEVGAKCALTRGDTDKAKELMSQLESFEGVIAYMNNRAVAYARAGMVDEGINLYRKAIKSLPDSQIDRKAVVLYNQGLAHVRGGELDDALVQLEKAVKISTSPVHKKALSLKQRVERALQKGEPLVLREADAGGARAAAGRLEPGGSGQPTPEGGVTAAGGGVAHDHGSVLTTVQLRRGDICCYLVFSTNERPPDKIKAMLANQPRFVRREAIERGEAFGAEKMMKR